MVQVFVQFLEKARSEVRRKYELKTKTVMKNFQMRYVFDRLNQVNDTDKTGLLQVEVRIIGTNKKKLVSTGIRLLKNQFSDKNGFTCKSHPNASRMMGNARRIYREIEDYCFSDKCKTLDDVKYWNKEKPNDGSFISFCRAELRKSDPSDAKIEHHNSLFRRLEDYGNINLFSQISYANIVDFDMYLKRFVKSPPTLYKRHSTLSMNYAFYVFRAN